MMRLTAAAFPLGRVVMTTSAYDALTAADMKIGIFWHSQRYWGDISENEARANDRALENGAPIRSAYIAENGRRFCVVTEANRSTTTVFLPNED